MKFLFKKHNHEKQLNVQRYDAMGCPEQIWLWTDPILESADGDYVLYEDYEALHAECEMLRSIINTLNGDNGERLTDLLETNER